MALRFQKRISILPGVRLNFSASGISTTIGAPGASVTLGGRGGQNANLGIPGSGLSLRVPFTGKPDRAPRAEPVPHSPDPDRYLPPQPAEGGMLPASPPMQAVRSTGIQELTTQGLAAFRDLLIEARHGRAIAERAVYAASNRTNETDRLVADNRASLERAERSLAEMEASFFRFL